MGGRSSFGDRCHCPGPAVRIHTSTCSCCPIRSSTTPILWRCNHLCAALTISCLWPLSSCRSLPCDGGTPCCWLILFPSNSPISVPGLPLCQPYCPSPEPLGDSLSPTLSDPAKNGLVLIAHGLQCHPDLLDLLLACRQFPILFLLLKDTC